MAADCCLLYFHPATHCGPSGRGCARASEGTRLWMLETPGEWKMIAHPNVVLRTQVRVWITLAVH